MRGDVQIPDAGIVREGDRHRRPLASRAPALLQEVRDAPGPGGIPGQRDRDRGGELHRAVLVEQPQQAVDLRAEGLPADC